MDPHLPDRVCGDELAGMTAEAMKPEAAEAAEIFRLIELIYDAAIAPEKWQVALDALGQAFHSAFASLISEDPSLRAITGRLSNGELEDAMKIYERIGIHISPLHVPMLVSRHECDVFTPSDLIGEREFYGSLFYQQYAVPNRYLDALIGYLVKDASRMEYIIITRTFGMERFSQADRLKLSLLMPHIRRAYLISRIFQAQARKTEMLEAALDELQAAAFMLGPDDEVLHFNDAARALLAGQGLFEMKDRRLAFASHGRAKQWAAAKTALFSLQHARHKRAEDLVMQDQDGHDHVLHIVPLSPAHTPAAEARLALFVRRAEARPQVAIELVARHFKLTPREMSVMVAIAQTGHVAVVAHILGIGAGTVKTHLKQLFAKTNTNSQAELARILMAYQTGVN